MTDQTPQYSNLSPFQLKDILIQLAHDETLNKAATREMLNAGRGNPNWVATTPREAFFLLGQFALTECKRVWNEPNLGGMPKASGIEGRLRAFASAQHGEGVELLVRAIDFGVKELGFNPDAFVHELTDAVIGDNYPVPDRMLVHSEKIVERYLTTELFAGRPPPGRFDLFATEGGTAAMCYVFDSLVENRILKKGDTIAVGTPIFTPYLEIPELERFSFHIVSVNQSQMKNGVHVWQHSASELKKLEDPSVKAFFVVNPSNPSSFAMNRESQDQLVEIVRHKRPDLLILTDDVYGTFVPGFRTIAADLPANTILVYSYSKHFGCTGWRLGVIALHEDNIVDRMIATLPERERATLHERYASLVPNPDQMKFIDRMVADSRAVALNHTAGLSLPQQAQMTLFSLFALLDENQAYKKRCQKSSTNASTS